MSRRGNKGSRKIDTLHLPIPTGYPLAFTQGSCEYNNCQPLEDDSEVPEEAEEEDDADEEEEAEDEEEEEEEAAFIAFISCLHASWVTSTTNSRSIFAKDSVFDTSSNLDSI